MIGRTLTACCALPLALGAQRPSPLLVRPLQDLRFGVLIPGVPTTIDPLQLAFSGQIEVTASRGAMIEVRYTLPNSMRLVGGSQQVRLQFDARSGGASAARSPTDIVRFDPRAPARFRFVTTDRASFFLGGQALPTRGQRVGSYAAPVVVTITNLGL
jgi:hypothetical protein